MTIKKRWIVIFLFPGILLFSFVYLASIVNVFGTSFTTWRITQAISFNGVGNYFTLFVSDKFQKALGNSLIWIILQSTVHVAIGIVFALITSRKKWYSTFSKTVFMLPNILSSAALGMLFYNVFNPMYGPVNKIIQFFGNKNFNVNWYANADTAFFAVTMTWLPFAAIIAILAAAELAAISDDIFEAAVIDGASEFQINWRIKLPLLKNAIGTGTILAATSMLQKMDILIMTSNGGPGNQTMNLPLLIYLTAMQDNNFGLANACGVILILIGLASIGIINKIYRMNETV
ncbi:carbohydrate ABC transporter permease [Leadbettera azotonutricia]|uniref:Putative binding-protein-dependent transport systems inner membrane component n=1 Tax=Leadbettera azotonutricia (strain ATCC BAA-888 / DSM 13862 / ZAS-9) TaxID=545695 RepID=F5Y6U8_LEAAZ|nr:sugar ABC transporter permease [Leadbettera azotonutricia]AEF81350.1 putative binding-protein-dependent transport systems inner membrane component [Leadbettera azotonutricia ZAS-9]